MTPNTTFVQRLLQLPLLQADWVLWVLIAVSMISVGVMVERFFFYRQRRLVIAPLRDAFAKALAARDYPGADAVLSTTDTLETNVMRQVLPEVSWGPDAVEDLVTGITQKEKERYDERLGLLATVASTAPFIGLFGTVLGIIHAFKDLASNLKDASMTAMSGVSEALVTTALGLLVAIPSLIACNFFKRRVKLSTNNALLLSRTLLAHLKSIE
jgi:biopolymer transport protein ExbB